MIEQEAKRATRAPRIGNSKHRRQIFLALLAAMSLLVVSCSSDGDSEDGEEGSTDTSAAESTETEDSAPEEAEEPEESDPIEDAPTEAEDPPAEEDEEPEEAAPEEAALTIELGEWFLTAPEGLTAGSLSFAVANTGENPHAFAIVEGDRYEDLPQLDNGAVDIEAVGDAYLGTTDNLAAGESGEITFELEAGNYVFFCPVQFGPNSHAAAGQVLSVTVG